MDRIREIGKFWHDMGLVAEYQRLNNSLGIEMLGQEDPLRRGLYERREQIGSQIDGDPGIYLVLPAGLIRKLPLLAIPVGVGLAAAWRRRHSSS